MKRLTILLLFLLLFTSCQKAQTPPTDLEAIRSRVAQSGDFVDFQAADGDFVETNFDAPDFLLNSAVYFSDRGEIGFFVLKDAQYANNMQSRIERYLESEKSAVLSLSELYPAQELADRLARFEEAKIGAAGPLVYYFLIDKTLGESAEELLAE